MRRALRRSVMGRLGMACYAIWVALALVTQDSTPCPTHDGPAAAAVAMAMMPAMQTAGATGSAHDAMHAGSQGSSHASSHGMHHACRCVGCGCCVAALDLGTPRVALVPAPAIVARGTTAPIAPRRVERPRVDRRLPFANAPPVMVSAAV